MFIALIVLSILAGLYAARGIFRAIATFRHSRGKRPAENQ
jgi:hypothetical protein